jgi:hypothetical protein
VTAFEVLVEIGKRTDTLRHQILIGEETAICLSVIQQRTGLESLEKWILQQLPLAEQEAYRKLRQK